VDPNVIVFISSAENKHDRDKLSIAFNVASLPARQGCPAIARIKECWCLSIN